MRSRLGRWGIPIVGSFGVYLLPLVGPHAVFLLGPTLIGGLATGGDYTPMWRATNVALALLAQLGSGLLLAWSIGGSRLRFLVWLAVIPALIAGLNVAYLVSIPSYFLIEADTTPEQTSWQTHCLVPEASLVQVRTPVTQPVSGLKDWWAYRATQRYSLLRLPDCTMLDPPLPVPTQQLGGRVDFTLSPQYAVPGSATLFNRYDMNVQRRSWWLLVNPMSPLTPAPAIPPIESAPILSTGADAVAWMERVSGPGSPVLERVVVRPLQQTSTPGDIRIALAPFGAGSYELLEVNTVAEEVIVWRNRSPLVIGFDGKPRDTTFTPGSTRAMSGSYLRHRAGWVAWDGYREEGTYQLSWSLDGRSGVHRATRGRSITSAAVDPSGHFIAISETTTLSIGNAPDVVYVIRTIDGRDVFRKYIARYSRTQTLFFEGGLFAYSELDGTHVLRIPDAAGAR